MKHLLSLLFWAYMSLTCIVLFWVALGIWALTWPFDPKKRILHRFSCYWGYHYLLLWPFWSPQIQGREHIPRGPSIIVANHQSLGDILLLYGLHRHFKWVSKASVFKVPFVGWNMVLNGYVGLQRGDRKSILKMLQDCRAHLEMGSSILMFPEGTRSQDGELRPFKIGSFSLARSLQLPVVPVVLDGTQEALPKSGFLLNTDQRVRLNVQVLPAITPEKFPDSTEELSQMIHEQMRLTLHQMRENTP